MSKIIRISDLKKTYDGKRFVLNNLNFSLEEGEIATIYGLSGCGKSTFLNIVGLLDDFSSGDYFFKEKRINPRFLNRYNNFRANNIGFVFQSYHLIDALTVEENILMPFLYNDIPVNFNVKQQIKNLLKHLDIENLLEKKTALLSGGEKQRVAVVRAMIKHPAVIIADEPTGNLDSENTQAVVYALHEATNQGTSVIIVTHNQNISFSKGKEYNLQNGVLEQ